MERFKAQKRKAEASPQRADFEREFGKDKVKDEPDGSWSLTVREDHDIRKAHEMQEGSRRIEVEEGAKQQAMMKRERVIRRDGRMVEFPEELVDQVKHRFKGGAGRNGKAVPLHFSMNDTQVPVWRRLCSVCGTGQGMWRQWSKPECDSAFECEICGCEDDWFWDRDEEA